MTYYKLHKKVLLCSRVSTIESKLDSIFSTHVRHEICDDSAV